MLESSTPCESIFSRVPNIWQRISYESFNTVSKELASQDQSNFIPGGSQETTDKSESFSQREQETARVPCTWPMKHKLYYSEKSKRPTEYRVRCTSWQSPDIGPSTSESEALKSTVIYQCPIPPHNRQGRHTRNTSKDCISRGLSRRIAYSACEKKGAIIFWIDNFKI